MKRKNLYNILKNFILILLCLYIFANISFAQENKKNEENKKYKNVAIIIDISKFENEDIPEIRFHEKKSVEMFESFLLAKKFDHIEFFSTINNKKKSLLNYPNLLHIKLYFEKFLQKMIDENTKIFIYFSTYSYSYKNENYLLMADTDLNNVEKTALKINDFIEYINNLKTKNKLVVFNIGKRISERRSNLNNFSINYIDNDSNSNSNNNSKGDSNNGSKNNSKNNNYFNNNFPIILSSKFDEYCYFDWSSKSDLFLSSFLKIIQNNDSLNIKKPEYTFSIFVNKIQRAMKPWLLENSVKQTVLLLDSKVEDKSKYYDILDLLLKKINKELVIKKVDELYNKFIEPEKTVEKKVENKDKIYNVRNIYVMNSRDNLDNVVIQFRLDNNKSNNDLNKIYVYKKYEIIKQDGRKVISIKTYNNKFKLMEETIYEIRSQFKLLKKIIYDTKTGKKVEAKIYKNVLFNSKLKKKDSFKVYYEYKINNKKYKVIEKYTYLEAAPITLDKFSFNKGYIFDFEKSIVVIDNGKNKKKTIKGKVYYIDKLGLVGFVEEDGNFMINKIINSKTFEEWKKLAKLKLDVNENSYLSFGYVNMFYTGFNFIFDYNLFKGQWLSLAINYIPVYININPIISNYYLLELKYKFKMFDMNLISLTNVNFSFGAGISINDNIFKPDSMEELGYYLVCGVNFKSLLFPDSTNFVVEYGLNGYYIFNDIFYKFGGSFYLNFGYYF